VLGGEGGLRTARGASPIRSGYCARCSRLQGSDYAIGEESIHPDWAGGMFLLFPRTLFEGLGGFDERYFLYYEDVDICARLTLLGRRVVLCPRARVVHHASAAAIAISDICDGT